jgi:hypothetical protein
MAESLSQTIAADPSGFEIWDRSIPFPAYDEMFDVDIVTHVTLERAQANGFHYLHESSITFHNGAFEVVWANHREREINTVNELIRGKSSQDGLTWTVAETVVEAPTSGSASFNHPVITSVDGKLYGFFTRWDDEQPSTEIFIRDDATRKWTTTGALIPSFVPFRAPMKLTNGNWLIGGESFWYEAAVAISDGDDFTSWRMVMLPRPESIELMFPETTILQRGERLIAICRPKHLNRAPVAVSDNYGETWTTLELSNFPLENAKPYCAKLSNGQQILVTGNAEEGRTLMTIAATRPGGEKFERIWKLRHQKHPRVRFFGGWGEGSRVGQATEWSYPSVIEKDGNVYISYTQGKEDCVLSIVPVRVLAVD